MFNTPVLYRGGLLTALGLILGLALLDWSDPASSMPDGTELAARLMAPFADPVEELTEQNTAVPDVPLPSQPLRIQAEPISVTSSHPSESEREGTGIASVSEEPPNVELTGEEDSLVEHEDSADGVASDIENAGDSEGQRLAVSEINGLDRSVAGRLLAEGAAVLVAELKDGRQLMYKVEGPNVFSDMMFVPWGPQAGDYSQLQVTVSANTDLLPVATLRHSLLKVAGPVPVEGYALVLSAETEAALLVEQRVLLADAGQDLEMLLAEGRSVVTHGCWQARGPLLRLTTAIVDGSAWRHPGRASC